MNENNPSFSSEYFNRVELRIAQEFALKALRKIAPTLRQNLGTYGGRKSEEAVSIVTKWDKWAQQELIEELSAFDAGIGFHGEEDNVTTNARVAWVIDPIDGTLHFSRGNGDRCHTALALVERQECRDCLAGHEKAVPVVSAIYNFAHDIAYTATSYDDSSKLTYVGNRATEEAPLKVGAKWELVECYTNSPETSGIIETRLQEMGVFAVRNAAASYSAVEICEGRLDGLVVLDNRFTGQQDIAPAALLVVQAGGEAHSLNKECFSSHDPTSEYGVGNVIISNGAMVSRYLDDAIKATIEST